MARFPNQKQKTKQAIAGYESCYTTAHAWLKDIFSLSSLQKDIHKQRYLNVFRKSFNLFIEAQSIRQEKKNSTYDQFLKQNELITNPQIGFIFLPIKKKQTLL